MNHRRNVKYLCITIIIANALTLLALLCAELLSLSADFYAVPGVISMVIGAATYCYIRYLSPPIRPNSKQHSPKADFRGLDRWIISAFATYAFLLIMLMLTK